MNLRSALKTAAILVLLGSTTGPALAAKRSATSTAHRPTALALVSRYFAALDHQGQPGHDDWNLERLYAPTITLLESLTTGSPRLHTGLGQVRAFDRANVLRWFLQRSEQLSRSVILTIEQPYVPGPGHELDRAGPWMTLFTIKSGKIVNLVWMSC